MQMADKKVCLSAYFKKFFGKLFEYGLLINSRLRRRMKWNVYQNPYLAHYFYMPGIWNLYSFQLSLICYYL